jgi:hypothetical protein
MKILGMGMEKRLSCKDAKAQREKNRRPILKEDRPLLCVFAPLQETYFYCRQGLSG